MNYKIVNETVFTIPNHYKRRTFFQWLKRERRVLKSYTLESDGICMDAGAINYIKEITDE